MKRAKKQNKSIAFLGCRLGDFLLPISAISDSLFAAADETEEACLIILYRVKTSGTVVI